MSKMKDKAIEQHNAKKETTTPIKIIIPKNTKTIELTLEQLKQTRTFADAHGIMPKQFPLEHHVFIQKIMDMATEAGAEPTVGKILASVSNIERISTTEAEAKGLDQEEAQNTAVKVVIGRIDLGNKFARELWNLSLGFMYNNKGIEVCIGTNIAICGNLTIYGDATHYRNYGRTGIELSEMFKDIESWLSDLEQIDILNSELLERMVAIPIDVPVVNEYIGVCLKEAVRKNYHKGDPFPLTMTEVNRMTSYIIDEEEKEIPVYTLYHLYNAATFILTHSPDLPNKFAVIKDFTTWFEYEWIIPREGIDVEFELLDKKE